MAHGGKRAGAGRPAGSVKVRTQIDEFNLKSNAQEYSEEMLQILVELARNSASENIRLSAATQLLDRAHGKAPQSKLPDIEPESDFKHAMLAYISSPYMNRDAPLMDRRPASESSPDLFKTSE